jgi:hypothetical protein
MTTASAARISSPTEIAALVPHLVGFVPEESLVLVCLRGPRRRVGLTMRVDLAECADAPSAAAALVGRAAHEQAVAAVLLVYTEGPDRHDELVDEVDEALASAGVALQDALLVRSGRWTSYLCGDKRCCPAEGTPLEDAPSPALQLVQAEQALRGRVVLPSRDQLVAELAPPASAGGCAAAAEALSSDVRARGRIAVQTDAVAAWAAAVAAAEDPRAVPDAERLAVSLQDVQVRDRVLAWAPDRPEPLGRLLRAVARAAPPPYDAPACTMLAVVAWVQGDGALANVALDRALLAEPTYPLAVLVREALDQQVPPSVVRAWLRATAS